MESAFPDVAHRQILNVTWTVILKIPRNALVSPKTFNFAEYLIPFQDMMPLVSVIITTYNRTVMVREAVASVLAQTFGDFEIIVVDDGGTDGTPEALATFRDVRVRRHPRRRGVSAARNTGIAAARGEWLAFLDSDDLWLPDKLARQMAYLAARPRLKLCQTDETWVRRGVRVNKPAAHAKTGGRIFLASLARCLVSPSAVVLHRQLFQDHGGFDENLPAAEDYDLWLRLSWRYEVDRKSVV